MNSTSSTRLIIKSRTVAMQLQKANPCVARKLNQLVSH